MTALGMTLLLVGAIAVLAESHVPSLGIIGGPGVLALGAGAVLAVAGLGGGAALAVLVALMVVTSAGGLLTVSLRKGVAVKRRRIRSGPERLVGHAGVVRSWTEDIGTVALDGGIWRARQSWSESDDPVLRPGDPVVVEHMQGLTVSVRRAEPWEVDA